MVDRGWSLRCQGSRSGGTDDVRRGRRANRSSAVWMVSTPGAAEPQEPRDVRLRLLS
jgi:hypothetical protein